MAEIHRIERSRRTLDLLGAAVAALLAFAAVPAALLFLVGNPLAGGLGHAWQPLWRDALCVVTLAAWVAWAACCAQLVRAVVAQVRSGHSVGPATVIDRLAARIALGVLALSSVGGPLVLSASAGAAPTPHHAGVSIGSDPTTSWTSTPTPTPTPTNNSPGGDAEPTGRHSKLYTVRHGETLWSIAEDHFDDGADWTTLAFLNLGRDIGNGRRFVDPTHVEAGWRLRLPADAAGPARAVPRRHLEAPDRAGAASDSFGHLPEIAALGMGSLACAGLARRARRRRRPPRFTEDPDLTLLLSDDAVDTATLVHRFADVPALTAFEAANRLLGWALEGRSPLPAVRTVSVTSLGVTFWLATPAVFDIPKQFVAVEDGSGTGWHVSHRILFDDVEHPGQRSHAPFLPVVFPVGDDEDATWLVAVGPGQVLPVLGASAPALERSLKSTIGVWDWSDMVLATADPTDPEFSQEATTDASIARHLLFFGAPDSLSPDVARRVAVVTTSTASTGDLTLLVDQHGVSIHPLGRVVRPHLQSEEAAKSVQELLALDAPAQPEPLGAPPLVVRTRNRPSQAVSGTASVTPGIIDVRLLALTPRLDGLREELPPNRARRAVELVAYLALHHPDVITSDRLRTRVLGSSDADAASKTLFNVAHAARRAMGVDDDGTPLLPTGTRNGLYQVSPVVTVDVRRATALAAEGTTYAEGDAALAIAHFRAALDLVEGEPLANALSGYTWWEAEGHGGRISAVLVDAACAMAALAGPREEFNLARWGIERARLVAPYSEALSRAAMQLAAAEGDADRLRHEWDECQRRIDELDPGSSPSPRTESVYGQLSRQLAGHPILAPESRALAAMRPRYAPATSDWEPTSAP